jgi:ornithine cyclodeaminase
VVLVGPGTGVPTAILDGNFITAIRTSAAGAIGLRYLARADSTTALIVGTGVQAEAQAGALGWWRQGLGLAVSEPLDTDGQTMAGNSAIGSPCRASPAGPRHRSKTRRSVSAAGGAAVVSCSPSG